jgi:hypothetical protein
MALVRIATKTMMVLFTAFDETEQSIKTNQLILLF